MKENKHVIVAVEGGSYFSSNMLGIQKMPDGYALMLVSDCTHFYYLRDDGVESSIHWDMWTVYRWAKQDKAKQELDT